MIVHKKCCEKGGAHAQIEYMSKKGPTESLIGVDPSDPETVALLHAMLDEWLTAPRGEMDYRDADHFIVYRRWPIGT